MLERRRSLNIVISKNVDVLLFAYFYLDEILQVILLSSLCHSFFIVTVNTFGEGLMRLAGGSGQSSHICSELKAGDADMPELLSLTAGIPDDPESTMHEVSESTNGDVLSNSLDNNQPVPKVILCSPDVIQMEWDYRYINIAEPVGLYNVGNTCFINSVLQCLTYTAPFANYFLCFSHKSKLFVFY